MLIPKRLVESDKFDEKKRVDKIAFLKGDNTVLPSDNLKNELEESRVKLDALYDYKVRCIVISSRAPFSKNKRIA